MARPQLKPKAARPRHFRGIIPCFLASMAKHASVLRVSHIARYALKPRDWDYRIGGIANVAEASQI